MTRTEKLAAAAGQSGADAVLITGAPNLVYATRTVGLEGVVFITAGGKAHLLTDWRYVEHAESALSGQGFEVSAPDARKYPQTVAELCKQYGVKALGFEENAMTVEQYEAYKVCQGVDFLPMTAALNALREIKEEWEAQNIEAAQRIAEQALEKLLPEIKPGKSEKELASLLDYYMNSLGSEGISFSTILVSGKKSSLPHGVPGGKLIEAGDFVTIDFGAVVNGYHSDMTRTFAVGHATDEMREVYDIVLRAQVAGCDALQAGMTSHGVHRASADIIDASGYGKYAPSGLGHSLGLQIHERPQATEGGVEVFKTGNIITIEPGIYIPDRFGVRIEDMVYLAESGKRNLTRFPKALTIL